MNHFLDQSYITGEDSDIFGNLRRASNNQEILGQSFTPTQLFPTNRISLYLKKVGSPTGHIWVEIHANTADPTVSTQFGSDSALVDVATLSGSFGFIDFDLATSAVLTPGTKYWILLYGDYTLS